MFTSGLVWIAAIHSGLEGQNKFRKSQVTMQVEPKIPDKVYVEVLAKLAQSQQI